MTFDEYQKQALKTAVDKQHELAHRVLGLVGEAGEIAEKFKKIYRDKNGEYNQEDIKEVSKEIGDVLWYCATLADYLDLNFDDIARQNIEKLRDRQKRNKLGGKGDNR